MLTVDGKTCILEITMQGNLVTADKEGTTLITIQDLHSFLSRANTLVYGKYHDVAEYYPVDPEQNP